MSASREQALTALLAVLSKSGEFKLIGRRNRDPEAIGPDQSPALLLLEHSEIYKRPSINLPPIRQLTVMAVVYNDVGSDENAIPSSAVNNVLDQIDALLKPDDMIKNVFTLGGLVSSALIDGEVTKAPGDMTGKSLAIVPIKITFP